MEGPTSEEVHAYGKFGVPELGVPSFSGKEETQKQLISKEIRRAEYSHTHSSQPPMNDRINHTT